MWLRRAKRPRRERGMMSVDFFYRIIIYELTWGNHGAKKIPAAHDAFFCGCGAQIGRNQRNETWLVLFIELNYIAVWNFTSQATTPHHATLQSERCRGLKYLLEMQQLTIAGWLVSWNNIDGEAAVCLCNTWRCRPINRQLFIHQEKFTFIGD